MRGRKKATNKSHVYIKKNHFYEVRGCWEENCRRCGKGEKRRRSEGAEQEGRGEAGKRAFSDSKLRSSSSPLCVQREASKRIFPLPLCDRATPTRRRTSARRCARFNSWRLKGAEALPLGPEGHTDSCGCVCVRARAPFQQRDIRAGGGETSRTQTHGRTGGAVFTHGAAPAAGVQVRSARRMWLHRGRWMFPAAWMKRSVPSPPSPTPLQTTRTPRGARFASALGWFKVIKVPS